jgi:hypothetical protein
MSRDMKPVGGVQVLACALRGCATAVAVVDVTASTVIHVARTAVNVLDAVTPDIVNRDSGK